MKSLISLSKADPAGIKWKNIVEFNSTINQLDITDICRLYHPETAKTDTSEALVEHVTRWKNIIGHKTHHNF